MKYMGGTFGDMKETLKDVLFFPCLVCITILNSNVDYIELAH